MTLKITDKVTNSNDTRSVFVKIRAKLDSDRNEGISRINVNCLHLSKYNVFLLMLHLSHISRGTAKESHWLMEGNTNRLCFDGLYIISFSDNQNPANLDHCRDLDAKEWIYDWNSFPFGHVCDDRNWSAIDHNYFHFVLLLSNVFVFDLQFNVSLLCLSDNQ